jgi:hypothetical protein
MENEISRRKFLKGTIVVAGGIVLGVTGYGIIKKHLN